MKVEMRCTGCVSPKLAAMVALDGPHPRGGVPPGCFTHRADQDLIAELALRKEVAPWVELYTAMRDGSPKDASRPLRNALQVVKVDCTNCGLPQRDAEIVATNRLHEYLSLPPEERENRRSGRRTSCPTCQKLGIQVFVADAEDGLKQGTLVGNVSTDVLVKLDEWVVQTGAAKPHLVQAKCLECGTDLYKHLRGVVAARGATKASERALGIDPGPMFPDGPVTHVVDGPGHSVLPPDGIDVPADPEPLTAEEEDPEGAIADAIEDENAPEPLVPEIEE